MEEIPDGPELEAAMARMRRRMAGHNRDLLQRKPIFGMAEPTTAPGFMAASDNVSITLMYGDPTSTVGALVSVVTARTHRLGVQAKSATYLMEDEHRRAHEHAGLAVPEWSEPSAEDGALVVDGKPVAARVFRDGVLWAAELVAQHGPDDDRNDGQVVVTVIVRGVPEGQVELVTLSDLQPFLDRRDEWIASMAVRERHTRPEDLDLPPANGLAAHRFLIDMTIADSAETFARMKARRPPASHGDERMRAWESAVRAQMHLADQDRDEANRAVTLLVNHMSDLAWEVDWFEDAQLRSAAIEETLGYYVFRANVASASAQQAWIRYWDARKPPFPQRWPEDTPRRGPLPEPEASVWRQHMEIVRPARQAWADAWNAWRRQRA